MDNWSVKTFAPWFSAIPLISPRGSFATRRRQRKKRLSGRGYANKSRACVCQERARCSMRRIRHPGINAPSAFTNPDKEGCGNNKPRGKCLQTPGREVGLFPPLSLTLFLSLSLSSCPLNPCLSLSLFLFIRVLPTLTWDGNFASYEHPFPFNFYRQVQTFLVFFFFIKQIVHANFLSANLW